MIRKLLILVFVPLSVVLSSASAENIIQSNENASEYNKQWQADQERKARSFDKQGEVEKAYEVRDFADKEVKEREGRTRALKDNDQNTAP